jgi:hypothetical protein
MNRGTGGAHHLLMPPTTDREPSVNWTDNRWITDGEPSDKDVSRGMPVEKQQMTGITGRVRAAGLVRRCGERGDEAISIGPSAVGRRLLRGARNDREP